MGIDLIRQHWPEYSSHPDSSLIAMFDECTSVMVDEYLALFDEVILFFLDWIDLDQFPILRDEYEDKMRVCIWNEYVTSKSQMSQASANRIFEYSSNLIVKVIALSLDHIVERSIKKPYHSQEFLDSLEEIKAHFVKRAALQLFNIDYSPIFEVIKAAEKRSAQPVDAINETVNTTHTQDQPTVDFASYLNQAGLELIPKIKEVATGYKGNKLVYLMEALRSLGCLKIKLEHLNQTELHKALEGLLGDAGSRQALNNAYSRIINSSVYKPKVDAVKQMLLS